MLTSVLHGSVFTALVASILVPCVWVLRLNTLYWSKQRLQLEVQLLLSDTEFEKIIRVTHQADQKIKCRLFLREGS